MEIPEITSSEPGSFPWQVLHQRHPAILTELRAHAAELDPAQVAELAELQAQYTGGAWDRAPFLRAENNFYRQILAIIDYFDHPRDPFDFLKEAELDDRDLPEFIDGLGATLDELLLAATWGNRADLSFRMQGVSSAQGGLVCDDRLAAVQLLAAGTRRIALVTDNAGRELIADLYLAEHLLTEGLTEHIDLHVKPYPYFVSDVIAADVTATLTRLAGSGGRGAGVAAALGQARGEGRLSVVTDAFHTSSMSFNQMTPQFEELLAEVGLTIMKGDLNYRRLVGDRLWPPTTPFADLVEYFPTPLLVLRTVKSEVVAGLDARTVTELDAAEPGWRVSGSHAMVQLHA